MDLATRPPATQPEAQLFRRLIVTNSRYWLKSAQDDTNRVLSETPQVFKSLEYALLWPAAWETARDLLLHLSPLMIRQGHGLAWEGLLCRGIARSAEEKDPAEIELRLELGNFYRLQGRLPEARQYLQESLSLCEQYCSKTHYCTLLNLLALVARLSADHDEALDYCQQVLAEQDASLSEKAEALNVMALVAYDRRQWDESLQHSEQALALYSALGDNYHIARILNNRGLALLRSGQSDKAEISYQEAIRYFQDSDDQTERFKAVMNLGNAFLMKQAYEAAIRQYQEALPIFQQYHYLIDLANVYNNLGMAYTGLAEWQSAKACFLASLEIARNLSDSYYLINTLDNLGNMFIKAKQLEQAHEVLEQALDILNMAPNNPSNNRLRQVVEKRLSKLKNATTTVGPNGPYC